ncbi:hypothetical protein ACSNOI_07375 [Actinomadura kijaniata]|uniref:luciferase domain-containing protein n=1 Tax=Actinomadura kijaniata TaxID=46161 RepID=UPI003F1CF4FA
MALAEQDQRELINKGWGKRYPLYSPTINVVMLYGPRDDEELQIAKAVVSASYRYATGHDLPQRLVAERHRPARDKPPAVALQMPARRPC